MNTWKRRWAASLALGWLTLAACDPVDTCDSDQYYKFGACRPCPEESESTGRACRCTDPDKEIVDGTCVFKEGKGPPDAGMPDAAVVGPCESYCGFLKVCIADNGLVASVIPEVVSEVGIAGEDVSGCVSTCATDESEAANSAALACFAERSAGASCAGDQTLDGADEALTIIDGCCTEHAGSPLCTRLCSAIGLSELASSMTPACM